MPSGSPSGLAFQLRALYRGTWFIWAPALAWFVWRRADVRPLEWFDAVLFLFMIGPVALASWGAKQTDRYGQMIAAAAMCRWQEVLDRLAELEELLRRSGEDFAEHEISVRRAEALAGLGRTAEAEALMERLHGLGVVPELMFQLRSATVHAAARDFDAVERCYRKARELKPEDASIRLSLGDFLVRRRRDADAAEAELTAARRHEIAEVSMWSVHRLEGMIALERGDARRANDLLQKAVAEVSKLAASPLTPFIVQDLCAYLALALAQLGQIASAKLYFQAAEDLLVAHRETELIERCRAAFGELDG